MCSFFRFSLNTVIFTLLIGASSSSANEWYFSWGYQRDFWAPGDIHVSQPGLGNDFTVHHVKAVDLPQWNEGGLIFDKAPTVPQFNLRFGRFLSSHHDLAIEFSLEHSKYTSTLNQVAHVTGMINGQPVDTDAVLTSDYFYYRLHNGANHIMVNLVKRFPLIGPLNQTYSLSLLVKGGVGIMLPHAESTIMGNASDVGPKSLGNMVGFSQGWWQINGWTTGAEVAVRFIPIKPIFLELSDKLAYAHLTNVPVYQGRADQILWMNAIIFNLGVTIGGSGVEEDPVAKPL